MARMTCLKNLNFVNLHFRDVIPNSDGYESDRDYSKVRVNRRE